MGKKHYHIMVGLRGCCMPDTNYTVPSMAKAKKAAKDEQRNWNDAEMQRDRKDQDPMRGAAESGYYSKHNSITISDACYDDCKNEDE